MTAPVLGPALAALVLVLSFAILREQRLGGTVALLRWHLGATAAGAIAIGRGPGAGMLVAGGIVLLASAIWIGGVLGRLDRRTGHASREPASMTSIPLIAAGLGLTALAVLAVTGAGTAPGRQQSALALAATLLGLLSASRPSPPALYLARFAALADGLALLGAGSNLVLFAAAAVLAPGLLVVATATIGRAGGLPTGGETRP